MVPIDDLKVAHFGIPKIKNGSRIKIGKLHTLNINVDHHFNWFQKKIKDKIICIVGTDAFCILLIVSVYLIAG